MLLWSSPEDTLNQADVLSGFAYLLYWSDLNV